jgi:hypothetical protein
MTRTLLLTVAAMLVGAMPLGAQPVKWTQVSAIEADLYADWNPYVYGGSPAEARIGVTTSEGPSQYVTLGIQGTDATHSQFVWWTDSNNGRVSAPFTGHAATVKITLADVGRDTVVTFIGNGVVLEKRTFTDWAANWVLDSPMVAGTTWVNGTDSRNTATRITQAVPGSRTLGWTRTTLETTWRRFAGGGPADVRGGGLVAVDAVVGYCYGNFPPVIP